MRIAYIGPARGTSLHRARALERLGHEVQIIDPWDWLGRSKWVSRWLFYAGGFGSDWLISRRIINSVLHLGPDLIWINNGEFLGHSVLSDLRKIHAVIVNYSNDNPYAAKNEMRWRHFKKAIPFYDLIVTTFEEAKQKLIRSGARQVMRVFLSADEVAHRILDLSPEDYSRFGAEVSFIAQWAPERGPFIKALIERDVPVSIWGIHWQKAPEWRYLKGSWRGPGMFDERFGKVIQASKISLCLLSKSARNLHTGRSIIIPVMGGLLCAERSSEHLYLYEEGKEAVFWSSVDECAELCRELLADDAKRAEIARFGRERALRNNLFNEPIMASVVNEAVCIHKSKT